MMSSTRPTVRTGSVGACHNAGFTSTWNKSLQMPFVVQVILGKEAEAVQSSVSKAAEPLIDWA